MRLTDIYQNYLSTYLISTLPNLDMDYFSHFKKLTGKFKYENFKITANLNHREAERKKTYSKQLYPYGGIYIYDKQF